MGTGIVKPGYAEDGRMRGDGGAFLVAAFLVVVVVVVLDWEG